MAGQNLNVSRLRLQLSLCNILKPSQFENVDVARAAPTGDAPFELHLSDQQFNWLLKRVLY